MASYRKKSWTGRAIAQLSSYFLVEPGVRGAWELGPFSVKLGGYTKGAGGTLLSLVSVMVSWRRWGAAGASAALHLWGSQ